MSALCGGLRATVSVAVLVAVAPRPAAADGAGAEVPSDAMNGFGYLRLGYAARPTGAARGGPGFALGGRLAIGSFGADLSVLNLTADSAAGGEGFSGAVGPGDRLDTGEGSHAVAVAGYELRRNRTFRLSASSKGGFRSIRSRPSRASEIHACTSI
jgi:hypothetical protein